MKTSLDCIPCFVRQTLEAARFVCDDQQVHEQMLRQVLRSTAEMDLAQCPPRVAQQIHRNLRQIAAVDDPYRSAKDRFNRMALDMLPRLTQQVLAAADPLAMAVRLAIAGNVIDLGVSGHITEDQVHEEVRRTLDEPFTGDMDAFRQAVDDARDILYLADNAGEIVFDRLLVEQLSGKRVTVAVRGGPVINDATIADAETAGLDRLVEVIENGSDAPGTIIEDCSEAFRERFAGADLIIAKGQGNFETLSEVDANLVFLFKVKCPVIAAYAGLLLGTHALIHRNGFMRPGDIATLNTNNAGSQPLPAN